MAAAKQPIQKAVQATPVVGKQIPVGVKIISVLYYIGAVVMLLLGITMIFGAGFMGSLANQIPFMAILGTGFFIIGAIIIIAFAVLSLFVARGLWKGQKWARIVAIIFAVLGVIGAIINIVSGDFGSIIKLIINGLIGYYLWFVNSVKTAFA